MVVVVAREGLVEGEMLLDDLGAEQIGCGEGHHRIIGSDMVAEAYAHIREIFPQCLDDAQVGIGGISGVGEHAVEDDDILAACILQHADGLVAL